MMTLCRNTPSRMAAEHYKLKLEVLGLLPDDEARTRRLAIFALASFAILGVAFLKVYVALERGRHNIGFLILAAIAFTFISYKLANPRRTALGGRMFRNLQLLFSTHRKNTSSDSFHIKNDESMLIAAVWGTANLGSKNHAWVHKAFGKSEKSGSDDSSSCGSSCGSSGGDSGSSGGDSGGSSCGSSCGGGGGCGGCGS